MKKGLAIFLIIVSALSFFITYLLTDKEERERMEKVEEEIAREFQIPGDPEMAEPEEIYPLLVDVARESGVNVFRTTIYYNENDQVEIMKYVLLTGETRFFDAFRLESGRLLTAEETQHGDQFLATVETGERSQIGTLADFAGNDLIWIRSLKTAYNNLPVGGRYFAETNNVKAFDAFIELLAAKVNARYPESSPGPFTAKDFMTPDNSSHGGLARSTIDTLNNIAFVLIFILTLILIVYYMFHEAKRIGIMKMHGLSSVRIWFLLAGRLIGIVFVLSATLVIFAAMLIKGSTFQFLAGVLVGLIKSYLLMAAGSLIAYFYISKVKISDTIKNRKDTGGVFALNTLLKAGCSILLILSGLLIWNNYVEIRAKQEEAKYWEQTKDYAVFYPVYVGYDLEDIKSGSMREIVVQAIELYPVLNSMGALFVEARDYREGVFPEDFDPEMRSIKVNPNYLHEYPVKDIHNNPVEVPEETRDWILLVPEIYRHRERDILTFFQRTRERDKDIDRSAPDRLKEQSIKIIWTAGGQKVFSFDPVIYPEQNNLIVDPIIQVVTLKNSFGFDRVNICNGKGGGDPLKVKLIGRDTALTLEKLKPVLEGLKLDDNLRRLITVDQYVLAETYRLQQMVKMLMIASLVLAVGSLLLVVQNLIIFFDKYQRKFVVRRLFGVGLFRAYREYFLLFSAVWVLQLLITFVVNSLNRNAAAPGSFLVLAFAVILIELAASAVALGFIEKRSRVQVLKGGV